MVPSLIHVSRRVNEKRVILGIETSCDETAVALVREDGRILAHALRSQIEAHQAYGGVVPEIAARQHMLFLDQLLQDALKESSLGLADVDGIAVTAGPGLIGGVIVGVMAAKAYASVHQKPLFAINHLEGHALTVRLDAHVPFPYLMLLVSGGHCQILAVEGIGQYGKLGGTLDDALGEAFDKTAKMMGLPYPGGPALEKLARHGDSSRFNFPRPCLNRPDCNFSFSGLKTAVRLCLENLKSKGAVNEEDKADIAASFQQAVADVLVDRLNHAIGIYTQAYDGKRIVVAGGVAANQFLKTRLQLLCDKHGFSLHVPPMALCTDNAAMIAWAGIERLKQNPNGDEATFDARARWPLIHYTSSAA
ncbi:MAG: tRNA (adenosine(37)-N6)-threonylcarbamoyltransferase complex transferase subunit TsaD [Rickettsiales bacterium]